MCHGQAGTMSKTPPTKPDTANPDRSNRDGAKSPVPVDWLEDEPRRSRLTFSKVMVGAIVVASFGVWAYAYSGQAGRTAPDTLASPTFSALAEPTCAAAMAELDALPNALDAEDNRERADQIALANNVLSTMVDDLEAHMDDPSVTLDDRDRGITSRWIADWRTYIADRTDYGNRLAEDPTAVLYVSAVNGERLEKRIPRFANTNRMSSCITPSDVG